MIRPYRLFATLTLTALLPSISLAQGTPIHFSFGAGVAIPTGDFGSGLDAGYHLAGALSIRPPASPLEFQGEGTFNEFNVSDQFRAAGDEKVRVWSLGANALYHFNPPTSLTGSLYGIGGLGFYNTHDTFFDESDTNLGWNLGGGFRYPLSGFSVYIEARYHYVTNTSVRYVPITFGLVF